MGGLEGDKGWGAGRTWISSLLPKQGLLKNAIKNAVTNRNEE